MEKAIDEFVAHLKLRNLSERTIDSYRQSLVAIFNGDDPLELDQAEIERRLSDIDASPRTRAKYLSALRTFYKFHRARGNIDHNPTENIPAIRYSTKLPDYLTEQELKRFMEAVKLHKNARDIAMFSVLFGCGLRISELLSLPLDAHKNGYLIVKGKGGKERVIPLSRRVRKALAEYEPDEKAKKAGRLFPISRQMVSILVKRYARKARIAKNLSPHGCRHTFGFLSYEKTKDIRAVQELLGHSQLSTTQIYTQISEDSKKRAVEGLRW